MGGIKDSTHQEVMSEGHPGVPVYEVPKACSLPEGLGSLGPKALHLLARIHSWNSQPVITRFDSGADITLMSEEFYKSLPELSAIREGL